MKRFIRCMAVVVSVIVFPNFINPPGISAEPQIDGAWWVVQNQEAKKSAIAGVIEGIRLGRDFATWNLFEPDKECFDEAVESFNHYMRYLRFLKPEQIMDGLDWLYADQENRKISLHRAVWLVANRLRGKPEKKLQEMIENHRKSSR